MRPSACDVSLRLRRVSRDDWGGAATNRLTPQRRSTGNDLSARVPRDSPEERCNKRRAAFKFIF